MITNPKNILFLSHYFYPRIGGVEKHIFRVAQELINQKFQITVLTSQYDRHLPEEEYLDELKVIRIKLHNSNWQHPSKTKIWKWIIKHRYLLKQADIIHCHDVFFWYLPFRLLLPFKPVFTTFHGYEGVCPPAYKAILVRKMSEKLSWGNICVGNYIEKWYGTRADQITYGGTDIPITKTQPLSLHSAIFLGRLDPDSGLHLYLDAIRHLRKERLNFQIEFCGDGSLRKRAGKVGKVLGFQKNISTPLLKHRFAFVSSYLTILEAMAHKRLVFAVYDNQLKKDTLTSSPFAKYINISSSVTQLEQQIKYYLNNQQAEKAKVMQAYIWVKTQTWNAVAGKYTKLWFKS